MHACLLACLLSFLLACLPACLPACLLACLLVCVFECLFVGAFVNSFVRLYVSVCVCWSGLCVGAIFHVCYNRGACGWKTVEPPTVLELRVWVLIYEKP